MVSAVGTLKIHVDTADDFVMRKGQNRRTISLFLLALVVALPLAGCRTAKVGQRCTGNETAQTKTHVLVCKKGKFAVLMSKAEGLRLLAEYQAAQAAAAVETPATTAVTAPTTTVAPPAPPEVFKVVAGYQHSCAIVRGLVSCVGENTSGEIGNGNNNEALSWTATGIRDAVDISTRSQTTCALRVAGTVTCWGYGLGGELGNGAHANSNTPVDVLGINNAISLSSNGGGTCAVLANNAVKCWGFRFGSATPITLSVPPSTQIAVGSTHMCGVRLDDSRPWCAGGNGEGQLGNGTMDYSEPPVAVLGGSSYRQIAIGENTTCGTRSDGKPACWGSDEGFRLLGDGIVGDSSTPVVSPTLTNIGAVSIGVTHACALSTGGSVHCWGQGASGRIGNGLAANAFVPAAVTGISNAVQISAGLYHTCAMLADHTVKCWGGSGIAKGTGSTDSAMSPVQSTPVAP